MRTPPSVTYNLTNGTAIRHTNPKHSAPSLQSPKGEPTHKMPWGTLAHPVTTFPPPIILHAYLGLSSLRPVRVPVLSATSPSLFTVTPLFIITCRRGLPFTLISDFDSLCSPSYLSISDTLVRYSDPLWQAFPRPFLYLTLASTMTKP